jgi:hypothetical protein
MLAGGLGGTMGDMLMHSLDTVKTRQQGDPTVPPKYATLGQSYRTIFRQEGVFRGLYSGVLPALVGSFSGTMIFFGSYELSKRVMIDDLSIPPAVAYFSAGVVADVVASPAYVPSEVLKTRLQLQGRFNNPWFPESGYNYRGTMDALRSIVREEGLGALFYGYKATLYRDVPFSALQFLFYEQERRLAKQLIGKGDDIGLGLEILTGASAGCMAGVITCPLDVVKTRIQTQVIRGSSPLGIKSGSNTTLSSSISQQSQSQSNTTPASNSTSRSSKASNMKLPIPPTRNISTSSPSTTLRPHMAATLDTSSVITGLKIIYRTEGTWGLFRGVGPRAVWTSFQSGCMFLMYQTFLKWFEANQAL